MGSANKSRSRILFYQSNDKFKYLQAYKEGKYFGQTFYGATHLSKYGCDVEIMQNPEPSRLENFLKTKLKTDISFFKHTHSLIRNSKKADIIYAPYPSGLAFLLCLKLLGIFKKKIVVIVHNNRRNFILQEIYLRGTDKIICISKATFQHIPEKFKSKTSYLEWGPDLDFYKQKKNSSTQQSVHNYFISTGKADRDFETLLRALNNTNLPAILYLPKDYSPTEIKPNIQIKNYKGLFFPIDLLDEYSNALAFVIPTNNNTKLLGLTSLFEAMAMKKPVIMTYNKYIDFDIEKENVGLWANLKDVDDWIKKLKYLHENPEEAKKMGDKGYALCSNRYNLNLFSQKLAAVIKSL